MRAYFFLQSGVSKTLKPGTGRQPAMNKQTTKNPMKQTKKPKPIS